MIDGPESDQQITETVTVELVDGDTSQPSATITVAACEGPAVLPEVTFAFTKSASTASASVGDTVEYSYCGQNTSDIPLEVVRLVDDRLGVVIELPGVETVVQPGESLCNTDLGLPVNYAVTLEDVGTTIVNNAVVTVRTLEPTPREFQAVAVTEVDVPLPPIVLALMGGDRSWVCHRAESDSNPYSRIDASSSSTDADEHVDHAEDIIPPGPWGPGQHFDPDHGGIWLNGCNNVTGVVPADPTADARDMHRWPRTTRGGDGGDDSARSGLHRHAGRPR